VGAVLVGLVALGVYAFTCCRVVSPVGDAGELTAAALTLGIPHPPGYPVFVLIGHLFGWLPLEPAAFRINVMAAVFGAGAASMAYLALLELGLEPVVSAGAALTVAFSTTVWQSSVSGEFRSLQLFWLASWTALTFRWFRQPGRTLGVGMAAWAGIGLLIHYTDVVPCLATLVAILATERWVRPPLWHMGLAFLAGLLPVLYLPLRARQSPALNWGEAGTLEGLAWDLLRRGYGGPTQMAAGTSGDLGISLMLKQWLLACLNDATVVGLVLVLVGLGLAWRRWPRQATWTLFCMLVLGPIFIVVEHPLPESDFWSVLGRQLLGFWVGFAVFLAAGLQRFIEAVPRGRMVALLVPLLPLVFNYPACNLSRETVADRYGRDMLGVLAPQAVLLASSDPACSTTIYLQAVEGVRPDVMLVDDNLLWSPWYRHQLTTRHAPELAGFDWSQLDKTKDPDPLVDWLCKKRPVYVDQPWPSMDGRFMEQGVVYQVATTTEEVVHFDPMPALRRLDQEVAAWQGTTKNAADDRHDAEAAFVRFIHRQYALGYANLGVALGRRGFDNDARRALISAVTLDPHSVNAHVNLGYWFASREDYAHAAEQYQAAVQDDPSNVEAWRALAEVCGRAGRADEAVKYKAMADRLQGH
jgi:hypothetical protein